MATKCNSISRTFPTSCLDTLSIVLPLLIFYVLLCNPKAHDYITSKKTLVIQKNYSLYKLQLNQWLLTTLDVL